jgi:spore coat protein JC
MWIYEKKLQYPVNIKKPDAKLARMILSQIGGTDGELGASMRYLNQRFIAPYNQTKAILTDIGTEEFAHMEILSAMMVQLTDGLTAEQIEEQGFSSYFLNHTTGVYPSDSSGSAFTCAYFQSTGDPISDINEDMAAEQKARTTYDNILRFTRDPDVRDPIRYLRQREIVHFQRFGEALRITTDNLDFKNFYAFNPAFDKKKR